MSGNEDSYILILVARWTMSNATFEVSQRRVMGKVFAWRKMPSLRCQGSCMVYAGWRWIGTYSYRNPTRIALAIFLGVVERAQHKHACTN